jgi:hypothetical protein
MAIKFGTSISVTIYLKNECPKTIAEMAIIIPRTHLK